MKKSYWIMAISTTLIIATFIFMSFLYIKGSQREEFAKQITSVPVLNKYLDGFPLDGEIRYIYKKYHRGENLLFTGIAPFEKIKEFCEKNDWYILEAKDHQTIKTVLDEYPASTEFYPLSFTSEDIVIEKPKEKDTTVIIINCIKENDRVTGYAIHNY